MPDDNIGFFLRPAGKQRVQQIPYILLFLQGFYKQRVPCVPRRFGGVFRSPSPQQMVIIAKHPEAFLLRLQEAKLRRYAPFYRLWRRSAPVVIGDSKIRSQPFCRFHAGQVKEPCRKINHIAVCLTAEAVEASVRFQAGRFIFVEGAARHAVPSYMDSIMLRSLPCGDSLLYRFKYIQTQSSFQSP